MNGYTAWITVNIVLALLSCGMYLTSRLEDDACDRYTLEGMSMVLAALCAASFAIMGVFKHFGF